MKKLDTKAIDDLIPYYDHFKNQISDISLVNCLIWNDKYHFHYTIIDKALVLINVKGDKQYFSVPISESTENLDLNHIIKTLQKSFGLPLHFKKLSKNQLASMSAICEGQIIEPNRDESDYIYDFESLKYLRGKKYHKKKNHVNHFQKHYPSFEFRLYNTEDYASVKALLDLWCDDKNGDLDPNLVIEREGILKLLKLETKIPIKVGLLWVDSKLVGLIIGEVINKDTLLIHIEKADTAYDGVYTALSYHFYHLYDEKDISFINREQDLGIEGLRKSKESYHPIALHHKYEFIIT